MAAAEGAAAGKLEPRAAPRRRNSTSIYDTRIAGLYDLAETIGRGHFAVVKSARHVFTGECVAAKVIDKTKLDPVSTAHMMQEVRCMKLVQHPNVVRLYEVIDTQTKLFIILELGDYDMYDFIMRRGDSAVDEAEAQRYFYQIIHAIDYCHRLHVVHRDLKPENVVFFERLGMVKLTDFGFSNLFVPGEQLETSCGSLAYSAPEILLGDTYDAPAVDVWSLGVILYMLVCSRLPFNEANDPETLTKILDCSFTLPPHLSEPCKNLIRGMLVREPAKRATLTELMASPWVQAGNLGHADSLPLISKEQLPDDVHATIVDQMVAGAIASADHIHAALELDDYSHITSTYYLLAERVLRKEREEQAQKLVCSAANAKSDPLLGLTADDELAPETMGAPTQTAASAEPKAALANVPRSRSNSWRGRRRSCGMVKEESEEELSSYFGGVGGSARLSPRNVSPSASSLFGSSPSSRDRVSPAAIQELLDLSTRLGSSTGGRRSPDNRTSRSPSPAGSGRTSPSVSFVRFKAIGAVAPLRKLSSSPHLLGICEEGEEETVAGVETAAAGGGAVASSLPSRRSVASALPPATYSSVRMIRPRQAVVSPDVLRRYAHNSGNRSRRSTSCSSSEASDDDTAGRFGLIASRYGCRRPDDFDDEPPAAGGGGRGGVRAFTMIKPVAEEPSSCEHDGSSNGEKGGGGGATQLAALRYRQLDAGKLIGKLQKLALHPIREMPMRRFLAFVRQWPATRSHVSSSGRLNASSWYQSLRQPKSYEHLYRVDHAPETTAAQQTTDKLLAGSPETRSGARATARRRMRRRRRPDVVVASRCGAQLTEFDGAQFAQSPVVG